MEEDLKKALQTLKGGGVILYPTDTIWGLGCDATNSKAIEKIFQIKKRAESKSLISLVANISQLEKYVEDIPEISYELMEAAMNPLTIIYSSPIGIAPNALAEDGSIGIRVTKESFTNALCRHFGKPIISTSANESGEKTPLNFKEIDKKIIESADYVVNYRQDDNIKSSPSNIIKIQSGGIIKIIR